MKGSNGNGVADDLERNVISGNSVDGIRSGGSDNTVVYCNLIGVSVDGTLNIRNKGDGIHVGQSANGSHQIENNLISHKPVGVRFESSAVNLTFFENYIKGKGVGFLNETTAVLDLQNNYWNSPNGPSDGNPACLTSAGGSGDQVACSSSSGDIITHPAATPPPVCGITIP